MEEKQGYFPNFQARFQKIRGYRRVRNRRFLAALLLVILSLAAIFLLTQFSTKAARENIENTLRQSVEQRKLSADSRLRSMQQTAYYLMHLIYPYIHSGADVVEQYQEYLQLSAFLAIYEGGYNGYTGSNFILSSARLYVPDEKIYSRQGDMFFAISELENSDQAEESACSKNVGINWIETRMVYRSNSGAKIPYETISCCYSTRDASDYSKISCVLMLDLGVSNLNELLDSGDSSGSTGYLVNAQGRCLAALDESLLEQTIFDEALMKQICQEDAGCIKKDGFAYFYNKLEFNNWYLVMRYPLGALSALSREEACLLGVMILVAIGIALTMIFILAYTYTSNITIMRINRSLDALNAGKDNLNEDSYQFPSSLHRLERNADQMVAVVKDLIESRYKDRIAIAESQMESLQAQIKPHFLYNTLDTIKWTVLDGNSQDAAWMINTLTKYLRRSINTSPAAIPLREEIELSKDYLVLMQKRFENRFRTSFEVEKETEECRIPKLSLQPLLENALLHGILYCEKPDKELTVRAWTSGKSLYIEVEDNGNGMSEEKRKMLESGGGGYGLSNVRKRLDLFSGGSGSFQIFSREGAGTCIAIQIPAHTADEEPL